MQPTGPTATPPQSHILKTMQPQQIFIPSSGSNGSSNIRPAQHNTLFRGPPTTATPRGGTRHVSMQPMYPHTMHQGVVMPTFPSFGPRQPAYQSAQYPYTQPLQQFYSSYPFYPPIQQPQTHHRGPVGVNPGVSVNVGNTLSGQPSPNGGTQAQISLTPGAVLPVAACSSAVLSVASPGPGQQQVGVGIPPILGVTVPGTAQTQTAPTKFRRRSHAVPIINPKTQKDIFENEPIPNTPEVDNQDQLTSVPTVSGELQTVSTQQDLSIGMTSSLPTDGHTIIYSMDVHQLQQRDATTAQTPVVSAMSDAPSVEIRPTLQKPRTKKIIPITSPKDETKKACISTKSSQDASKQQKQQSKKTNEPFINFFNIHQLPTVSQVPQENQNETPQNPQLSIKSYTQLETTIHQQPTSVITNLASKIQLFKDNGFATIINHNIKDIEQKRDFSRSNSPDLAVGHNIHNDNVSDVALADTQLIKVTRVSSVVDEIEACEKNIKINEKEPSLTPTTTPTSIVIESVTLAPNSCNNNKNEGQISGTATTKNCFITVVENNCNNSDKNNTALNDEILNAKTVHESDSIPDSPTSDETDRSCVQKDTEIFQIQKANENMPPLLRTQAEATCTRSTNHSMVSYALAAGGIKAAKPTQHSTNNPSAATSAPGAGFSPIALINYNKGQWSPQNPSGKKQYEREQLLQLREAQASRVQPEVKYVAILPQPNLMPSFARGSNISKRVQSMVGSIGSNRSGGCDGGSSYISKQASMSGVNSRGSTKGMMYVNLSLNQDVKLNETDNAWRPRVLNTSRDVDGDPTLQSQREKEELVRNVRGILNKLTPEKFDTLVEEIIKLKIDSPDKMENVMVLVFEKAIDEPNFSVSYARLCHRLINEVKVRDKRMESGTKSNLEHFRTALLDKTEREFTQNVLKCAAKEAKLQPILDKIKNCTDPSEKIELQAQLEEEGRKIRRRSGGTVRFIGELFKISLLNGKIINYCVEVLLEPKNEDMLECLCKLLATVGAKFEQTPIPKERGCYSLERVMDRMQDIASRKDNFKVSSRVRFMLQDVIDLRKNKWKSSRNEAPKTMEQIEKEAKNEQLSAQYLNYSGILPGSGGSGSSGSGNQNSGKRDDRGNTRYDSLPGSGYSGSNSQRGDIGSLRRQQQGSSVAVGSGGGGSNITGSGNNCFGTNNDDNTWQVQTGKGGRFLMVDSNKLEGLNQNLDMGSKKMGGVQQFIWGTTLQSVPTTTPSNSFAVLSNLVDSNKSNSDRNRERDRGGLRNKGTFNKGSIERDRYNIDRGTHSRTGSSRGSRENSTSSSHQGGRVMMNPSTTQKSASHKNYTQSITSRIQGKTIGISPMPSASTNSLYHNRPEKSHLVCQSQQRLRGDSPNPSSFPTAPPPAVFDEPSSDDLQLMKSVTIEMTETVANEKVVTRAIVPMINRLSDKKLCGFLYYILADYLHLAEVSQVYRRYIANIVIYMVKNKFIAAEHFQLAYEHFCKISSDLIHDVPDLWLYVFEFTAPLIEKHILTIEDLWVKQLRENKIGKKFLENFLLCCTREIGPCFTKNMWKKFDMNWKDFMPENDVKNFIEINKFEYIETECALPDIVFKESREKYISKVVERVEHLLIEGSDHNKIIDYINGNIGNTDKKFISSLTTVVTNYAIKFKDDFKDDSYKLDNDCFRQVCVPVLQRYIDLNPEREMECLYAMQLLVHSLEHPRQLLTELFGELYDNDVISPELFHKWRDSKDQSAGKGVAVKGLGPFFNNLVNDETSEENN